MKTKTFPVSTVIASRLWRRSNLIFLALAFSSILVSLSYAAVSTYTFVTGGGTDRWVYAIDALNIPPSTCPNIAGEELRPDFYSQISASDDVWASSPVCNSNYPTHHFRFTIYEATAAISSMNFLWEGCSSGTAAILYLYIASSSSWVSGGSLPGGTTYETILSTTIIDVGSFLSHYSTATTLDIIVESYGMPVGKFYTDFIKVLVNSVIIPAAPTGFTGIDITTGSIKWIWNDNSSPPNDGESGFRIYSSTGGLIKDLSPNTTYWTETGLSVNTSYSRYVRAYNAAGASDSFIAAKYTLANPPANTSVTNVYFSSVTINWTINSNPGGTTYEIYRSLFDMVFVLVSTASAPPYTNTGIADGTTHYYKIRAVNGGDVATAYDTMVSTLTHKIPDTTPPTVFITVPVNAFYYELPVVSGTAQDNVGVSIGQVRIKRQSDNYEWNGTTFVPTMNVWNTVSFYSPGSWNYNTGNTWVIGSTYTVIARARDTSNNYSTVYATCTFCFIAKPTTASNGIIPKITGGSVSVFPPGGEIRVYIPPNTYTTDVTLTVTVLVLIPVSYQPEIKNTNTLTCIGIETTVTGNSGEPKNDIQITMNYRGIDVVTNDRDKLAIAYYEIFNAGDSNGKWIICPSSPIFDIATGTGRVTATTRHLSKFALVVFRGPAADLKGAFAYPSLFRYSDGIPLTFANLTSNATVRVCTISGSFVWEGIADSNGNLTWNGIGDDGRQLGTGLYVCSAFNKDGKNIGKVFKIIVTR